MTAPTLAADVQACLVELLGPAAETRITRPLTAQEAADVEAALTAHGGDPVAALGMHVDDDTAAIIRSLPVGSVR